MTCVATLQSINYYSKQSKVPFCFFFNTIKALKPLISHANWTIKVNAKWVLHHHVHVGVSLPSSDVRASSFRASGGLEPGFF